MLFFFYKNHPFCGSFIFEETSKSLQIIQISPGVGRADGHSPRKTWKLKQPKLGNGRIIMYIFKFIVKKTTLVMCSLKFRQSPQSESLISQAVVESVSWLSFWLWWVFRGWFACGSVGTWSSKNKKKHNRYDLVDRRSDRLAKIGIETR